jgi:hypothetical protein
MGKAKKTTMKQILVIILTFFTFQVSGQKLRPEIKNLVQEIEKYNELESEHVGHAGVTTDQYRNFEKLRDKATIDELLELLKHKNSVVKGYTSWALADKMYSNLANILPEFLRTGETVTTQHGCIVSKGDLATEFYNRLYYQHFHHKLSLKDSLFFKSQIIQLDSVILYSNGDTRLLYTALANNNGNLKTYDRIRELAEKKNNSKALVALAKYEKQSDIPFLIKRGKTAFLAISVFPDSAFWNFILGYQSQEKSLDYFLAVSSFRNESALGVLKNIYKNCDSIQLNELDEALIKNYCASYQDLILKIWEEHKTIDLTITQRLISDCPEKSSKSFAKGLLSDKGFNFLELDYNYGTDDSILPLMLQTISQQDKDLMLSICNKNIQTAQFTNLEPFLAFIKANKVTQTTSSLLQRLKEKNQAFEIFHMIETLLSFNNSDTNKNMIEILIANQKDWDWGNWSEHFRKLFKANDIKFD